MGYRCKTCAYETARWMGFCPQCRGGELSESTGTGDRRSAEVVGIGAAHLDSRRRHRPVGLAEVDRVLGGGFVPGAAVLLGGEPGVGKSTLLLQIASHMATDDPVLLISAEESVSQVAMRAHRIGAIRERLVVTAEHDIDTIIATIERTRPSLAVVDSIQTVAARDVGGAAGGIAQVRECGSRLVAVARRLGVPVVLVSHVTKEGQLAGPKVLEHVVDVVLALEGDHDGGLRLLRCSKNRHGSVDRVGVFEMTELGMVEVSDPSERLVGDWGGGVAGTVLFPTVQGRRAVLVEVQALVVHSRAPQPRRSTKGVDGARVHQLLAVLDRHAGLTFHDQEVYVNVVGGMRIVEPAIDLPVALALASSRTGVPLGRLAAYGEVGLTGELRSVGRSSLRLEEARRFGVEDFATPTVGQALVRTLADRRLTTTSEQRAPSAA